eukprot:981632-Prorocentrum_minimum.AAC.2
MFAQKDAGYGYGCGYPIGGGLIDIDPLPLPNLDGDDPTMGLDILSSSESDSSAMHNFEVPDDAAPVSCADSKATELKAFTSTSTKDWVQRHGQNGQKNPAQQPQQLKPTAVKNADVDIVVPSSPYGQPLHPSASSSSLDNSFTVASEPAATSAVMAGTGMSRSASEPAFRVTAPVRVPTTARRSAKPKQKATSLKALTTTVLSTTVNNRRIKKRDKGARIVCLNCNSSSTPQWRMGPTGPKTKRIFPPVQLSKFIRSLMNCTLRADIVRHQPRCVLSRCFREKHKTCIRFRELHASMSIVNQPQYDRGSLLYYILTFECLVGVHRLFAMLVEFGTRRDCLCGFPRRYKPPAGLAQPVLQVDKMLGW